MTLRDMPSGISLFFTEYIPFTILGVNGIIKQNFKEVSL